MTAEALISLYERVAERTRAGDARGAREAFFRSTGIRPSHPAADASDRLPSAPFLRYSVPRRVDRLALASGARDVAKFEDMTGEASRHLEAELRALGLTCVVVGPYEKRFDAVVTSAGASEPLFAVIASRGDGARRVADAERDRTPEGTRQAGLALGYPPCCVEHFVRVEQSARARLEGINEAAIRSIAHVEDELPWELHPMSTHSPVGFTPCSARCPGALAFARRVLGGVRQLDPEGYRVVRRVLARPVLIFRYPIFYVLDGAVREGRRVRYARAVAHDDERLRTSALVSWRRAEIDPLVARADSIELRDEALELRREENLVARWELEVPRVPLLLCPNQAGEEDDGALA
ncbi:MAG: DUF483 domain-containing protein [Polyangiaceae bacterium]|nr:DUF483 domain-containing protein [Polyangiaceae bacterium]